VIASISGTLVERAGEELVIETSGGVGYHVTVPSGVFERLPRQGDQCRLHTELVIREDAWTLYGFDRAEDRSIFRRLLTASGFGPKLAIALLSHLGPERTVRAIQAKDATVLSTVSGIGRKKAERLILELHDRFPETVTGGVAAVPGRPTSEAARALAALGYTPAQADEALKHVKQEGASTAVAVKQALQYLSNKGGN
jgi:Holliday junction DNA helicase RuvA